METGATEMEIKGLFLLNFTKYVSWPPARLSANGALAICVSAGNPVLQVLKELAGKSSLAGRRIEVRATQDPASQTQCHMMFRGVSEPRMDRETAAALRENGVLVVGEGADFLASGGTIRLVVDGGRIRFDVDLDAARGAGLRISSQLLRLARNVQGTAGA